MHAITHHKSNLVIIDALKCLSLTGISENYIKLQQY